MFGITTVFACVFFYLKFIKQSEILLAHITKDQRAQSIILDLIGIDKTITVTILPIFGIIMIATGYYVLFYLRKEREESESQNGRP